MSDLSDGRQRTITSLGDFNEKVRSSMLALQRSPSKIRAFFKKPLSNTQVSIYLRID
jgi:hypothetical protein